MRLYEEYKKENETLKIYYDENAANPRKDFDNLGTMACWHRRYSLGDKHNYSPEEFLNEINDKNAVIFPLYMCDHSGLALSMAPFACPWDSGQIGWIYVPKEKAREEFGVKRISRKLRKRIQEILQGEIEAYEHYLNGNVFGYVLKEGLCRCPG